MIEDATIFQAVQFIDLLNKDISRLIGTVDEEMQVQDYKSLWGTPIACKSSRQLSLSAMWIPHAFARAYVPETTDNETYSNFAFLNIYLTPKHHRKPLAHWGVARRTEGVDIFAIWNQRMLRPDGPNFLRKDNIEPFEPYDELSEALDSFHHAVKLLTELNSAEALERLVLAPIQRELESMSEQGSKGKQQ